MMKAASGKTQKGAPDSAPPSVTSQLSFPSTVYRQADKAARKEALYDRRFTLAASERGL